MNTTCPICCDVLGAARATTECGHAYCTRCLLDAVAKNVGTEEGSTRNQCPMCRSNICDEVEPSQNLTIRLSDLEDEVSDLSERDRHATASAEMFRDNFLRMEQLRQRQQDRVIKKNGQIAALRSHVVELEWDAAELRKTYEYSLGVSVRRSETIYRLQEQLDEMARLDHYCQGEKTTPRKVVWGGVLASKEAEMDGFDGSSIVECEARPLPHTEDLPLLLMRMHHFAAREIQRILRAHNVRKHDSRRAAPSHIDTQRAYIASIAHLIAEADKIRVAAARTIQNFWIEWKYDAYSDMDTEADVWGDIAPSFDSDGDESSHDSAWQVVTSDDERVLRHPLTRAADLISAALRASNAYADEMRRSWTRNPSSVDASWVAHFAIGEHTASVVERRP